MGGCASPKLILPSEDYVHMLVVHTLSDTHLAATLAAPAVISADPKMLFCMLAMPGVVLSARRCMLPAAATL